MKKKSCALPKAAFPVKFRVRSPRHALQLARDLIRPINNWTQGEFAVRLDPKNDDMPVKVDAKSPRAEAFCALGALRRVNTRHQKQAQRFLEEAAASFLRVLDVDAAGNEDDIFDVNDSYGHKEVLLMFRRAIARAKRAEKR